MNDSESGNVSVGIGIISGAITIGGFLYNLYTTGNLIVHIVIAVSLIISIISFVIYTLKKNPRIGYTIKKNFAYLKHKAEPYRVEDKKSIYTFKKRTSMEHTKEHTIKSRVSQLHTFEDIFHWSKPQTLDEINDMFKNIHSNIDKHTISAERFENWMSYTVTFERIGKGSTQDISVTMTNLEDPNKEALLFLSGNALVKTKKLTLRVEFKEHDLVPKNIRYKIFDNYASEYPIITEQLSVQTDEKDGTRFIEKTESKPIKGYRYVINWNF